jgi:hypothetical protein
MFDVQRAGSWRCCKRLVCGGLGRAISSGRAEIDRFGAAAGMFDMQPAGFAALLQAIGERLVERLVEAPDLVVGDAPRVTNYRFTS